MTSCRALVRAKPRVVVISMLIWVKNKLVGCKARFNGQTEDYSYQPGVSVSLVVGERVGLRLVGSDLVTVGGVRVPPAEGPRDRMQHDSQILSHSNSDTIVPVRPMIAKTRCGR